MKNVKSKIKKIKIRKLKYRKYFTYLFGIFIFVLFFLLFYHFIFFQRIYPNIHISGINLGGLSRSEAINKLKNHPYSNLVLLTYEDEAFSIPLDGVGFSYDFEKTIDNANHPYSISHNPLNLFTSLALISNEKQFPLVFKLDKTKLDEEISSISNNIVLTNAEDPSVSLLKGAAVVSKGTPGESIDNEKLIKSIENNLGKGIDSEIAIPIKTVDPTLSEEQALIYEDRAHILLNKSIAVSIDDITYYYDASDIFPLLRAGGGYKDYGLNIISNEISDKIDRPAQNPIFVFQGGLVKEFKPAQDGITIDRDSFEMLFIESLVSLENTKDEEVSFKADIVRVSPDYNTEDVNDLGIKELIGRGSSRYSGSISSRIFNISHASKKFNGVLVEPNSVFSFNEIVGDISQETGFKQAYIIKDGATILGDGGGVCQVSTTLFRAALDTGLPIIERRAHAYRVSYYEQGSPPGIDATVYAPSPDLKIKNDTPAHLLIQTFANTAAATLDFEIYGTADGRTSTITKPIVTDVVPPPEDLYTDDPTLPIGTIEQIDWKAWGAKVRFDYIVKRDGETIYEKTFYSNFRPWQAKFLRGTGPVIQ